MLLQASRPAYTEQVISSIESATANEAEFARAQPGLVGSRPTVVLTTAQYLSIYPGWAAAQEELTRLSTNSVQRFAGPAASTTWHGNTQNWSWRPSMTC
jgi:hypothetical protein